MGMQPTVVVFKCTSDASLISRFIFREKALMLFIGLIAFLMDFIGLLRKCNLC